MQEAEDSDVDTQSEEDLDVDRTGISEETEFREVRALLAHRVGHAESLRDRNDLPHLRGTRGRIALVDDCIHRGFHFRSVVLQRVALAQLLHLVGMQPRRSLVERPGYCFGCTSRTHRSLRLRSGLASFER